MAEYTVEDALDGIGPAPVAGELRRSEASGHRYRYHASRVDGSRLYMYAVGKRLLGKKDEAVRWGRVDADGNDIMVTPAGLEHPLV